jgi:hypothetical protein
MNIDPKASDVAHRKPGLLERYVDLLYRRKVRSKIALMRLGKQMTSDEFKSLTQEEHRSALVRSVTFFVLGLITAYVILRILFAAGVARADEPPKKAFLIGDSQGWLLMQDMPRLTPPGWTVSGAPVPGSSVISWGRNDHKKEFARLRRAKPDAILVVLGTNDAYMGPRIIRNERPFLMRLLVQLESVTTNIIWVGPPWLERRPSGVEHFQMMLSGLDGQRITYLDSTVLDLAFWEDKMHCARPGPAGCEQWARWIWSQVAVQEVNK